MTDQSKFDLKFSLNKDQMQNIEHKGMVETLQPGLGYECSHEIR